MKKLKELRKKKNITQIRLSIAAEVSQETISAYESGKAFPSANTLIKIADFLDTSVDYLLDRTDNPNSTIYKENNLNEELLNNFSKLNTKEKKEVIWYCKTIKKRDDEEK